MSTAHYTSRRTRLLAVLALVDAVPSVVGTVFGHDLGLRAFDAFMASVQTLVFVSLRRGRNGWVIGCLLAFSAEMVVWGIYAEHGGALTPFATAVVGWLLAVSILLSHRGRPAVEADQP